MMGGKNTRGVKTGVNLPLKGMKKNILGGKMLLQIS